jgi:hypothetical protein
MIPCRNNSTNPTGLKTKLLEIQNFAQCKTQPPTHPREKEEGKKKTRKKTTAASSSVDAFLISDDQLVLAILLLIKTHVVRHFPAAHCNVEYKECSSLQLQYYWHQAAAEDQKLQQHHLGCMDPVAQLVHSAATILISMIFLLSTRTITSTRCSTNKSTTLAAAGVLIAMAA